MKENYVFDVITLLWPPLSRSTCGIVVLVVARLRSPGSYIPILIVPVACFEVNRLTPRVRSRFNYDIEAQLRFLVPTAGQFVRISLTGRQTALLTKAIRADIDNSLNVQPHLLLKIHCKHAFIAAYPDALVGG